MSHLEGGLREKNWQSLELEPGLYSTSQESIAFLAGRLGLEIFAVIVELVSGLFLLKILGRWVSCSLLRNEIR